jgi:hypothetical protein
MPTAKYPAFEVLKPYFDLVQKGLRGLVDIEHFSIRLPMTHFLSFFTTFPVGLGRSALGQIPR